MLMKVFELTQECVPAVAELMCTIKPEWWDYNGAFGQLSDINESIKTVGWYLGEDETNPKGWLLCRELVGYRTIELECSGFDDNGVFKEERAHMPCELFPLCRLPAIHGICECSLTESSKAPGADLRQRGSSRWTP